MPYRFTYIHNLTGETYMDNPENDFIEEEEDIIDIDDEDIDLAFAPLEEEDDEGDWDSIFDEEDFGFSDISEGEWDDILSEIDRLTNDSDEDETVIELLNELEDEFDEDDIEEHF
jgi:hypothetical protein